MSLLAPAGTRRAPARQPGTSSVVLLVVVTAVTAGGALYDAWDPDPAVGGGVTPEALLALGACYLAATALAVGVAEAGLRTVAWLTAARDPHAATAGRRRRAGSPAPR